MTKKLAFTGPLRYLATLMNDLTTLLLLLSFDTQHSAKQKYIHCEEGKKRRDPPVVFETAHEEVFLRVDFDNFLQKKKQF
jgi:hypothetical protein